MSSPRREPTDDPTSESKYIALVITGFALALLMGGILVLALSLHDDPPPSGEPPGTLSWEERLIFAGLLVAIAVGVMISLYWASRRDRVSAERAQRTLRQAEEQLAAADELTLPALWAVTQQRLGAYHEIATGQARTSFRNAQVAMAIGFALLAVFAALAANARSTTAGVVTGALGAVAAALAGYISRTFVRSQESSAGHLRSYFDQPLEFSRYLAAERLLSSVQHLDAEQRAAILADLLRSVIAPGGAAPTGPAGSAPSAVTINLPTPSPPNATGPGGAAGTPPS